MNNTKFALKDVEKKKIYLMGWVTLLVFPIPAFIALYFTHDFTLREFFDLDRFKFHHLITGGIIGIVYAYLANFAMETKLFKSVPLRVDQLVKSMNLTIGESIFLSICAGVGEELLFRVGVQTYIGPILGGILFVALHGYLNPFNWRQSLYGIIVLPLAFILGYAFEYVGLWFAIAIHFAYDLTLFLSFDKEETEKENVENHKEIGS